MNDQQIKLNLKTIRQQKLKLPIPIIEIYFEFTQREAK